MYVPIYMRICFLLFIFLYFMMDIFTSIVTAVYFCKCQRIKQNQQLLDRDAATADHISSHRFEPFLAHNFVFLLIFVHLSGIHPS